MILSNFRKTRSVAYRIVSYRIVSYRIVSYRIVSYHIFFKNTEKETANQTVELISNKNKQVLYSLNLYTKKMTILTSVEIMILSLERNVKNSNYN